MSKRFKWVVLVSETAPYTTFEILVHDRGGRVDDLTVLHNEPARIYKVSFPRGVLRKDFIEFWRSFNGKTDCSPVRKQARPPATQARDSVPRFELPAF